MSIVPQAGPGAGVPLWTFTSWMVLLVLQTAYCLRRSLSLPGSLQPHFLLANQSQCGGLGFWNSPIARTE